MIIEIKSSIIHLSFFFLNSSQSETYSPYKHVSSIVKQFINYLTRKTKLAFQFFFAHMHLEYERGWGKSEFLTPPLPLFTFSRFGPFISKLRENCGQIESKKINMPQSLYYSQKLA